MGEFKSVSIEELKRDNPRLCLSPKRALNKCYLCSEYDKCESRRINPEKDKLIKELKAKKEEYKLKLIQIDEQLNEVLS